MKQRYTFKSLNLQVPTQGEALVGLTFLDPDEGYEVTVKAAAYFINPQGWGWVLDTNGGSFTVYAD